MAFAARPQRRWMRHWLAPAALIVLCGCLASAQAFGVFFAGDDFVYAAYAASHPWPGLVDAAAHRWLSGAGAFAACRWLFGLDPALYHVPIAAFHIANGLLLWRLVRRLEPARPRFALVTALVFVCHAAAFSVLAWLSAGFNEAPAVTAALLATHLTLTAMERRSLWIACSAGVVILLATGLKQHVVLAVWYVAMFGLYFGLNRPGSDPAPRSAWVKPLTAAVVAVSSVAVWLATIVVPRMPAAMSSPPYTRVYDPASVGEGYLRYLPHALNPVALAREPLGFQEAMPAAFSGWTRTTPAALRTAMLLVWIVVIVVSARRSRLLPLAATAAVVLVASLSVAVVLPEHQYDYYAYFGLPAASILAAMVVGAVWRVLPAADGFRRVLAAAAVVVLVVTAWFQGRLLSSTNLVARNAEDGRIVDRVATIAPPRTALYFVPPVQRAMEDTLQGASVALLRPDRALTTQFAGSPGVPDTFSSRPGLWLVATRPAATGGWEALVLDHAQWRTPETSIRLADGVELRQPFSVGDGALTAIHVAVSPWRGRCDLTFAIHAAASGPNESEPPLVDGRLDCGRDISNGFAEIAVPPDRIARGRYALSLRVDAGILDVPVARADGTGFDPVSYRHGGAWERREHALAIRGVLRVVD